MVVAPPRDRSFLSSFVRQKFLRAPSHESSRALPYISRVLDLGREYCEYCTTSSCEDDSLGSHIHPYCGLDKEVVALIGRPHHVSCSK